MFTMNVPVSVGVPEINPEDGSTVNPDGRAVAVYAVGRLVAVIWKVKGSPSKHEAVEALVIPGVIGFAITIWLWLSPSAFAATVRK
jgi:hypothetical protein